MKILKTLALAAALVAGAVPAAALTVPAGFTDSLVAVIPGPNSNYYGDIAADATGNYYVTGGASQDVYKVAPGGVVTVFARGSNSLALGVEVVGNNLYFGHSANGLYRKSLSGGAVQTLAAPGDGQVMGIAAASGNQLYITSNNTVRRYDIDTNSYVTMPALTGNQKPSVAIGKDGKVLITDYNANTIRSYDPTTNSYSVFRTGINLVSGLAVHAGTGDVYAVSEQLQQIVRISMDGLTQTVFATGMAVDAGFYPQGISFSADYTKLLYVAPGTGNTFNLRQVSGFSSYSASVPEPAMLALFGLGLVGVASRRRRRAA